MPLRPQATSCSRALAPSAPRWSASEAQASTPRYATESKFSLPHAIAVEGHGVDKDGKRVGRGGTSTITVTLKKGRYTFYCPVPGHRAAGMKGTLIVS